MPHDASQKHADGESLARMPHSPAGKPAPYWRVDRATRLWATRLRLSCLLPESREREAVRQAQRNQLSATIGSGRPTIEEAPDVVLIWHATELHQQIADERLRCSYARAGGENATVRGWIWPHA